MALVDQSTRRAGMIAAGVLSGLGMGAVAAALSGLALVWLLSAGPSRPARPTPESAEPAD